MSSSRIVRNILFSVTGITALGLYARQNQRNQQQTVTMKSVTHDVSTPSVLNSYDLLAKFVSNHRDGTAIFAVAVDRQSKNLSHQQVVELARLTIRYHHATYLDALAGQFPEIISRNWVNHALIAAGNRFMYNELLCTHEAGKLKNLNYLFDPKSELVLMEQTDSMSLAKAGMFTHDRKIVLIDSEYYDPGFKYHT